MRLQQKLVLQWPPAPPRSMAYQELLTSLSQVLRTTRGLCKCKSLQVSWTPGAEDARLHQPGSVKSCKIRVSGCTVRMESGLGQPDKQPRSWLRSRARQGSVAMASFIADLTRCCCIRGQLNTHIRLYIGPRTWRKKHGSGRPAKLEFMSSTPRAQRCNSFALRCECVAGRMDCGSCL